MTGKRLPRTVLAVLALGLFALEVVAFTSVGRTARAITGGDPATTMVAGKTAVRVLVAVAARGAERAVTGVAVGLAHAMRHATGPVRPTALTCSGRACVRSVVVIRAGHRPRSAAA